MRLQCTTSCKRLTRNGGLYYFATNGVCRGNPIVTCVSLVCSHRKLSDGNVVDSLRNPILATPSATRGTRCFDAIMGFSCHIRPG